MDIWSFYIMAILRHEWESSRSELGTERGVMWRSVVFDLLRHSRASFQHRDKVIVESTTKVVGVKDLY